MNSENQKSSNNNPELWLGLHGDFLYQYAMTRLGNNSQLAEDMVQETFLSALKTSAGYQGRSSERTWLVSILRNKIIDYYRSGKNKIFEQSDQLDEEFRDSGPRQGQWKEEFAPADWGDVPDRVFEKKEFSKILQKCMRGLPENLATIFALRELDGLDTKFICKEMSVSASNLWVILHRARKQLRRCLEDKWIGSLK